VCASPLDARARRRRVAFCVAVAAILSAPTAASAHPAPWSYVDFFVNGAAVDAQLTIHLFDLAHELGVREPSTLAEPDVLARQAGAAVALLEKRLIVVLNGETAVGVWERPAPSGQGDSVRIRVRYQAGRPVERLAVQARLFPYDALHQTFVNVYENGALATQAVLDAGQPDYIYATGVDPGAWSVIRMFVPIGIHHILIGPDHLLFLAGLLLLGGAWRRLLVVVTAFTLAHSVTLSLAVLGWVQPSPRIIEPAIALSIVYVGIDNLLVRGGRDARAWIAFAFGLIHGFGFANVLKEMALPPAALLWSLASFNVGVEIGQVTVVLLVAAMLNALRRRSERVGRQIGLWGSVLVIVAGAIWFVQRIL
jgi:hydrogenase/urease accessory protein HupE